MPAMELEWVDPPQEAFTVVHGSGIYADMARELRKEKNHGRWAKVPREFKTEQSAKHTAMRIKTGRVVSMPADTGFEAVHFEKSVWVKFTPPEEGEESGESGEPTRPQLVKPPQRQARRATPENVSAQIRAWAKENGWPGLPAHGRLPQDAINAYHEAMDAKESGES